MAGKRGTKPKRKTPGKPRRSRYNWVMPRALREPTREELSELNAKLRRHHAEQPLPPELFEKLQNMIERQILLQPMTRHEIDRVRFYYVVQELEAGKTMEVATEDATKWVKGTPAECGSETAEDSFYKINNDPDEKWQRGFPGVKIKVR